MTTGKIGERIARLHLMKNGYRMRDCNYRSQLGEIDIIAEKQGTLVFCEVKTRLGKQFGQPFEAVTRKKQERLMRLAEHYLAYKSLSGFNCRFDVVSVLLDSSGKPTEIKHIKNAF